MVHAFADVNCRWIELRTADERQTAVMQAMMWPRLGSTMT